MNPVILLNLYVFVTAYTDNRFELLGANLTRNDSTRLYYEEDEWFRLLCRSTGRTPSVDIFWQLNKTFVTYNPTIFIRKTILYYTDEKTTVSQKNTTLKLYEHYSELGTVASYTLRNSRVRCGAMNKDNEHDRVYSDDILLTILYTKVTLDKYYVEYKSGEQINFTCTIYGQVGEIKILWWIRRRPVPSKSNFKKMVWYTYFPSDLTFMRGTCPDFNCEININKSIPNISQHTFDISIYHDNKLMAKNNKTGKSFYGLMASHERNKHLKILLSDCKWWHEGWYRCIVGDLPAKQGFYTIGQRQEKPVIHVHVRDIIADQPILVTCLSAGGRPAPKTIMQLEKNGKILPNRVKDIAAKQPLEYFGNTSVTVEVTFRRNESQTQLRCITIIEKFNNYTMETTYNITTIYYKPIATGKPKTFYEGTELRIACPVNGLPVPTIAAWYHNDEMQEQYVKDNEIVKSRASKQDSGKWTCTAENFAGVTNVTVTVIVVDSRYNTTIKPGATGMEKPITITLIVVCLLGILIVIVIFVARYIIRQRRRRKLLLQTNEHGSGHELNSTAGLELQSVESPNELRAEIEVAGKKKIGKPDGDVISKKADPSFVRKKTDDACKSIISSRTQKSETHSTKNKRSSKKSRRIKKFKPDENDTLAEYS